MTNICPIFRCIDFSFGIFAGVWFMQMQKQNRLKWEKATLCEVILAILILLSIWVLNHSYDHIIPQIFLRPALIFLPTSIALVVCFVANKGRFTKMLSNKYLIQLGGISGYAYLIHQPIILNVKAFLRFYSGVFMDDKIFFNIIAMIASLSISILLSIVYSKVIKKFYL